MADRFIACHGDQRKSEGAGFAERINNRAFRSGAVTIKLECRFRNLANSLSICNALRSDFDVHIDWLSARCPVTGQRNPH